MTRKVKVILASLSVLMLSVVLTACGSSSSKGYDSSKPVADQVNKSVTGIDAGAGVTQSTRKALDQYGLSKNGWNLQTSSSSAMTSQLNKAYQKKQPIVVTGWQPHWMFKKYDLKFLNDPKNTYGKSEHIDAIAKKNLKSQKPGAYKLISQFHWNTDNMNSVMLKINGGEDPAKAGKEFVDNNSDLVNQWTKGVPKGNGQEVKLVNVAWDSEIASTNVLAQALQKMGYKPTIQSLEAQPMWTAIANGSADASISAWLPTTQGQYLDQFKNKIDHIGATIDGARTGLVVPKYMTNVNSIDDLNKK